MTIKLFVERQRIKYRLKSINRLEALRDSDVYSWAPHEQEYLEKEIARRYQTITVF